MPITYMNAKEQTYFLHRDSTKMGKPKYYFSMKREGHLAESIPEGFEIYENPNVLCEPGEVEEYDFGRFAGLRLRPVKPVLSLPKGSGRTVIEQLSVRKYTNLLRSDLGCTSMA